MEPKSIGNSISHLDPLKSTNIDKSKNIRNRASKIGTADQTKAKSGFQVDLSKESQEIAAAHRKALQVAMSTPDVRAERVEELKNKIKNGEYKIDSGKIADGILKEAVRDELAKTTP